MRALLQIARLLVRADPWAMARGAALSVIVLVMGAALLGLSGWFITATGLAGLAGVGIAFDVFRPSAGVRFLALGRAAARYGERLLTHDATLRALAALRVVLLRGFARLDARGLMGLRGEAALIRIVSDVDALDGVILRLVMPVAAALATHFIVLFMLVLVVGWSAAWVVFLGYIPAAALIFGLLARRSNAPSTQNEEAGQQLRRGVIDMMRDREALILGGQLARQEQRLHDMDQRARAAASCLDRAERDADALLSVLVAAVAMATFLAGAHALQSGHIGAPQAVIGFFVALALAEALLPLRRGVSDLGRMLGAAQRVVPYVSTPPDMADAAETRTEPLLSICRPDLSLVARAGEAIVLTGPSGSGKSTLLMQIAGLQDGPGITIRGTPPCAWQEVALRRTLAVLPQRSSLIAGTLRDNLSLSGDFEDDALWAALDVVDLADDLRRRDGLETRLGEAGRGLSGGQSRRVALARILLKKPAILILDEPTEGLDPATAHTVLYNLRKALPDALIVAAMHRGVDHPVFDRHIRLSAASVTMSPKLSGVQTYTAT